MSFSVGILYSVQEFLAFACKEQLSADQFAKQVRFSLVSPKEIIQVAQDCNWIHLTVEGQIGVTERGRTVAETVGDDLKLRLQIEDLISTYWPSWATRIQYGRKETIDYLPEEVRQCFAESGLLGEWGDDALNDPLVAWWKLVAKAVRMRRGERLDQTGHRAEYLSFKFETKRTGQSPDWIGLDTTFAGFDVLSRISEENPSELRIEVKGSERPPKNADFVLTRKESDTANDSDNYILHLWFISEIPQLYVVPFAEVSKHVPVDQSAGSWINARIPYAPFAEFRVA